MSALHKILSFIIIVTFSFLQLSGCTLFSYLLPQKKLYKLENNYALKCIKLNLWNEAKYHLEKAYQLNPTSPSINNNLAVVYEHFNDIDKSELFYQNAVKLSPDKIYRDNLNMFLKEYKTPKPNYLRSNY